MATCSEPGCRKTATLSWQREATPKETAAAQADMQARHDAVAHTHRRQIQMALVSRRQQRDMVADSAAKGDPEAAELLPYENQAVTAHEQALAEHPAPAPLPKLDQVHMAVFGCDDHAVDVESAALLHKPGCVPSGCVCHRKKASAKK